MSLPSSNEQQKRTTMCLESSLKGQHFSECVKRQHTLLLINCIAFTAQIMPASSSFFWHAV